MNCTNGGDEIFSGLLIIECGLVFVLNCFVHLQLIHLCVQQLPDLVTQLGVLYHMIESRVKIFHKLTKLHGKLYLLMTQVSTRKSTASLLLVLVKWMSSTIQSVDHFLKQSVVSSIKCWSLLPKVPGNAFKKSCFVHNPNRCLVYCHKGILKAGIRAADVCEDGSTRD